MNVITVTTPTAHDKVKFLIQIGGIELFALLVFVVDTISSYGSYNLTYSKDTTLFTRDSEFKEYWKDDISMKIQIHILVDSCEITTS